VISVVHKRKFSMSNIYLRKMISSAIGNFHFFKKGISMQMKRYHRCIHRLHPDAGFTLIEIMVVIAIIGILATMIVPKIMGRPDEARKVAAKQDVGTIVQSLKLYRLDIGRYPTAEQGLKALVERPSADPVPQNWKQGGYLDSLPKDPWGSSYQYLNPGSHGEIDVFSLGADGRSGGTGADSDIGNW
jgi:general secretion pathway protein G